MVHIFYILTHIAETLIPMFQWLGPWSYAILFALVFMETGLVVFPWLPGGSLVFLTSSFIAVKPILKMEIVIPVFFLPPSSVIPSTTISVTAFRIGAGSNAN